VPQILIDFLALERLFDLTGKTHLNLPERQLANELAYLVADKMWRDLGDEATDGEVYNIGQSNYEAGCYALNLVGVYQQGKHYTVHKVVVPLDGVRQHMASLVEVSKDALDELLSAIIENYVSYEGTLSGGRRSFLINKSLARAADLLVANGFAEKQEDKFRWTEKIGPIMKRWYIWDENGECRAEREQELREENAAKMAEILPWVVRRKAVAALNKRDHLTAMRILSNHWDGEQWTSFPFTRKKSGGHNAIDLRTLKLLIQKLD
jgi:hypothetical protein